MSDSTPKPPVISGTVFFKAMIEADEPVLEPPARSFNAEISMKPSEALHPARLATFSCLVMPGAPRECGLR